MSGRVSWNPIPDIAAQVSFGFIKSPEALTPLRNEHRTTASVLYNEPLAFAQYVTASAVWGQNVDDEGIRSNAYLLEADYHRRSDSIFSRAEFVQKSGDELVLDADPVALPVSPTLAETTFPIGAYTLGYVHDIRVMGTGTVTGLGAQVTFDTRPAVLQTFYGKQTPWGLEFFARFRPSAMR